MPNSNLSRRAVIGGIAATPILAAPVIAAEADPIFAAIDRFHRAREFHRQCLTKMDTYEAIVDRKAEELAAERLPAYQAAKATSGEVVRADDVVLNELRCKALWGELKDMPESVYARRWRDLGCDAEADAAWALFRTVPQSAAGAVAMIQFVQDQEAEGNEILEYYREFSDDHGQDWREKISEVFLSSVKTYLSGVRA
ncbi:MAG: hypothetical protein KF748_01255 [Xanthobacteraceae bacterium]|nr:hypothetical protein [Xanthobacteraceae bacterium]MBX3547760.1 hypothetical protein [Xanthobacteraceae bacterium]